MSKKVLYIGLGVAVVIALYFVFKPKKTTAINWQTAKVTRGDLKVTVTATGTLDALTTVEVGTQVSGTIAKLFVDFNSNVKKGQVIAMIDTTYLAAAITDASASLERAKIQMDQAKRVFDRTKKLFDEKMIAQIEYEQDLASYESARTNVTSAKAQYKRAKINLDYATIKAPIDGVIISRNIDLGQTVAASFNTPKLFGIANDLTKMQVKANVDEADIGGVKQGQIATFTVDAFPVDTFQGTVQQIRLEPTTTNSVVKYTVIIEVENKNMKLLPGMTANISIVVDERKDVLMVPSLALSFTPPAENMAEIIAAQPDSIKEKRMQKDSANESKKNGFSKSKKVWKKETGYIITKRVKTGVSDGISTEITDSKLKEGDEVVTGIIHEKITSTTQKSPFMPSPPKGARKF
jgi:HlyD family secretion protein